MAVRCGLWLNACEPGPLPMNRTDISLDSIARVLIRCFWMGIALIMISFVLFLISADQGYEFHKDIWTGLTRHEYDLIVLVVLFQLAFTYLPFMQTLFRTEPLNLDTWITLTAVAASVLVLVELEKLLIRMFNPHLRHAD